MIFGSGKGSGSSSVSAGTSSPASSNMLAAFANSPIAQRLTGNTPDAPEMAGSAFEQPGILGLVKAQSNYWQDRKEARGGKSVDYSDLLANLTKATEPPQLPSLPFPSASSSQPSLQEFLAQLSARNRGGNRR